MIKYVGPVVIYKIIDPHNYLLMTLDRKILQGSFEHERLKPAMIRTSEGNVTHSAKLKQIINTGIVLTPKMKISILFMTKNIFTKLYLVFKVCTENSFT